MSVKSRLLKATLAGLHGSGAARLLAPMTQGVGVIFMLHQVDPTPPPTFAPNRFLSVTPDFLDATIRHVVARGYEVVTLDEAHRRLVAHVEGPPFACFTFDDAYRDNRDHALPVFKRHGVPLTIYIPTDYADGRGNLWWLALEHAIRRLDAIEISLDDGIERLPAATADEKWAAHRRIYWWLRGRDDERHLRDVVDTLCHQAGFDPAHLCRELILSWPEIHALARDEPLITFGAHTKGHWAVAKLPAERARAEIADSIDRVGQELGRPCRHFCFPYGDAGSAGPRDFALAAEAGAVTAVTTRKGLISAQHRLRLTGLPRLSLNGDYQDLRYVEALMSGVPFALLNAASRVRQATSGGLRAVTGMQAKSGQG